MLQAIETRYNGYRFRSRLEARWAVFFDALDIKYEYEKEGFELDGDRYLPDFWVPSIDAWIEIKASEPTAVEQTKAFKLADKDEHPVVILHGPPGVRREWTSTEAGSYHFDYPTYKLWSYFGYHVPDNDAFQMAGWINKNRFEEYMLPAFLADKFPDRTIPTYDGSRESIMQLAALDCEYFEAKYRKPHPTWQFGLCDRASNWCWKERLVVDQDEHYVHPKIQEALADARSARFEFGERGR